MGSDKLWLDLSMLCVDAVCWCVVLMQCLCVDAVCWWSVLMQCVDAVCWCSVLLQCVDAVCWCSVDDIRIIKVTIEQTYGLTDKALILHLNGPVWILSLLLWLIMSYDSHFYFTLWIQYMTGKSSCDILCPHYIVADGTSTILLSIILNRIVRFI